MSFKPFLTDIKKTVNDSLSSNSSDTESTEMHKLYDAVISEDIDLAKSIIAQGLDYDQRDLSGNTLLHTVIINEAKPAVVKLVVELGFNINAVNDKNWTPLFIVRKYLVPNDMNKELHNWLKNSGALAKPNILSNSWE